MVEYEPIYKLLAEEMGVNREVSIIARVIEQKIKDEIQTKILNKKELINFRKGFNDNLPSKDFNITVSVSLHDILNNDSLFPVEFIQVNLQLKIYENNTDLKLKSLGEYDMETALNQSTKKINYGVIKLKYEVNFNTIEDDMEKMYSTIDHELLHALQVSLISYHKKQKNHNNRKSYNLNKNNNVFNILFSDDANKLNLYLPTAEYYLNNVELEARVQQLSRELNDTNQFSNYDYNKKIYDNCNIIQEYNRIKKYSYLQEYLSLNEYEKKQFIDILNDYNNTNKTSYGLTPPEKDLTEKTIISFLRQLDKIKDVKLSNLKRNFDKVFARRIMKDIGRASLHEMMYPKEKYTKDQIQNLKENLKRLKVEYKNDRIIIKNNTNIISEVIYEEFNETIGYFGNRITESYYNKNITNKVIKLLYITDDKVFIKTLMKRLIQEAKNKGYKQILIPKIRYSINSINPKNTFKTISINKEFNIINL